MSRITSLWCFDGAGVKRAQTLDRPVKTSSLLYRTVPHCTRRHSSLLASARIAQTWLQLSSVSSEGCHLHTKTGHLQAGTEFSVADFASGAVSAMCKDYQTSGSRRALRGTSQWVKVSSGEQPVLMHPRFETAHNKPLPLPIATSEATAQRREKGEPPEHFVPRAKIKTDRRICLSATMLYNNNHTKISLSMLSRILVLFPWCSVYRFIIGKCCKPLLQNAYQLTHAYTIFSLYTCLSLSWLWDFCACVAYFIQILSGIYYGDSQWSRHIGSVISPLRIIRHIIYRIINSDATTFFCSIGDLSVERLSH